MAKTNFYNQQQACEKLGVSADQLKELVRGGKLRELRDGGKVSYKAAEVDKLAEESSTAAAEAEIGQPMIDSLSGSLSAFDMLSTGELMLEDTGAHTPPGAAKESKADKPKKGNSEKKAKKSEPAPEDGGDNLSLAMDESVGTLDSMHTGDLVLEPVGEEEDSGISLASDKSGTDQINLDDTAAEAGEEDDKEGTVVTSIGVSVFDDDEVEQEADPLAQTVMSSGTDAVLGVDETGSGSGLLDLTRESDDTSLGAELLDEIYPADEGGAGEMGEATRAGLVEEEPAAQSAEFIPRQEAAAMAAQPTVAAAAPVSYAPDAISTGLTGVLFVTVLIMCIAGLAATAALQGVWPGILATLYANNWILCLASVAVAGIALGVGFMLGRRSES